MFNISFGEVFIIAVVGLIIIGPQRLPQTARFLGHIASRVQRQVTSVKTDIRREMELEDLKSIHREYEDTARDMRENFDKQSKQWREEATTVENTMRESLTDSAAETKNTTVADSVENDKTPTATVANVADAAKDNKTQTATVANIDNSVDSVKEDFAKK